MNQDEALKVADDYLRTLSAGDTVSLKLFPEHTETHDFGWVVYYGSSDPDNPVAGNAPLIIDRHTGNLFVTGTAYPISVYIQNYILTGDPNAVPGNTLVLELPGDDARRIDAVVAIRDYAEVSLNAAKELLEECIDGKNPSVKLELDENAAALTSRLHDLGFTVRRNVEMQ